MEMGQSNVKELDEEVETPPMLTKRLLEPCLDGS